MVRNVGDFQAIDLADEHSGEKLSGFGSSERAIRDNGKQRALRRGHFHRLKITRQRTAALELPLANHAGRHVGLVEVMPGALGRGGSGEREPGGEC